MIRSSGPPLRQRHRRNLMTRWHIYASLMRWDRPIGALLLLWPVLWSLWLAANGSPDPFLVGVFLIGTFLMRSAGCVINDFADRNFDGLVARTRGRPLAMGLASETEALGLFVGLLGLSALLVLALNRLTILLSLAAVVLAVIYPFMKRYTYLPQVYLGAAFGWAVPMAFAAVTGHVSPLAWLVFSTVILWVLVYDTEYAMVDRADDLRVGIKSTAILLADADRAAIALLQLILLIDLGLIGRQAALHWPYYFSLASCAGCFTYQQYLIRERVPEACFAAFMNNNWCGLLIQLGIVASYWGFPAA